jgi:hypothetical protein
LHEDTRDADSSAHLHVHRDDHKRLRRLRATRKLRRKPCEERSTSDLGASGDVSRSRTTLEVFGVDHRYLLDYQNSHRGTLMRPSSEKTTCRAPCEVVRLALRLFATGKLFHRHHLAMTSALCLASNVLKLVSHRLPQTDTTRRKWRSSKSCS